jgi:hypothetical protein
LEIRAEVLSVGPGGVMQARFFVNSPDVLSQKAFEDYAADPRKGNSYSAVRISCAPLAGEHHPRVLTLTDDKEPGLMPELRGWSKQPLHLESFGGSADQTHWTIRAKAKLPANEELILQFHFPIPSGWPARDPGRSGKMYLLDALLASAIPGKVLVKDGKGERQITTFTASLGEVGYGRLDEPRQAEPEQENRIDLDHGSDVEPFDCDVTPDTMPPTPVTEEQGAGPGFAEGQPGRRQVVIATAVVACVLGVAALIWRARRRRARQNGPRP